MEYAGAVLWDVMDRGKGNLLSDLGMFRWQVSIMIQFGVLCCIYNAMVLFFVYKA